MNLERLYNLRQGFSAKEDTLPPRIRLEAVSSAGDQAIPLDISKMMMEYYQLRGWDERGAPTPKRLASLDIDHLSPAGTLDR